RVRIMAGRTGPTSVGPGSCVTGFKSEIDNQDWIIAKAEHTIDNSGFTTQLELETKIPEWIAQT
ncbi:hypothetical protein NCS78_004338, partial [Escherichia coli]|nr:hypothetical protein [Escherichia coli]